jgi:hypothetical protein
MKKELKKAFKDETVDHVQGWDMNLGLVTFIYKSFDMFVVEGEMGKKAFVTFDGAYNRFMKECKHRDLDVVFTDGEYTDVESFMSLMGN